MNLGSLDLGFRIFLIVTCTMGVSYSSGYFFLARMTSRQYEISSLKRVAMELPLIVVLSCALWCVPVWFPFSAALQKQVTPLGFRITSICVLEFWWLLKVTLYAYVRERREFLRTSTASHQEITRMINEGEEVLRHLAASEQAKSLFPPIKEEQPETQPPKTRFEREPVI